MVVWAVVGRTESGDSFSYVFDFKPNVDQVEAVLYRDMPIEYEEVGFTNWRLEKLYFVTRADLTDAVVTAYKKWQERSTANEDG